MKVNVIYAADDKALDIKVTNTNKKQCFVTCVVLSRVRDAK